jgi:hypothetical protein
MADLEEESPCMKIVHVNLGFLNEVRRDMPILNSFRHDLYLQIPSIKSKNHRKKTTKLYCNIIINFKILKELLNSQITNLVISNWQTM